MLTIQNGERINEWIVSGSLGHGGMGAVYRCHNHLSPKLQVALKVLYPTQFDDDRERFLREAEALAGLEHPGIVRIRTLGVDPDRGRFFLVMDLIDGQSLDRKLAAAPISEAEVIRVFSTIADALCHAHRRRIFHRDIKPANILIRPDGSPVLVDFGIALEDGRTRLTQQGQPIGTLSYLPPEAFTAAQVDPAQVDIYTLGITIYTALTGLPPFRLEPESNPNLQLARLLRLKTQIPCLDPGVGFHEGLRAIIRRATQADPAARYRDMGQLRDALLSLAPRPDKPPPAPRSGMGFLMGGALFAVGVSSIVTLMLGAATGLTWAFWPEAGPEVAAASAPIAPLDPAPAQQDAAEDAPKATSSSPVGPVEEGPVEVKADGETRIETRSLKTSVSVPVAQRHTFTDVASRQLQKRATDLGYTTITDFQIGDVRCNNTNCTGSATATASRTIAEVESSDGATEPEQPQRSKAPAASSAEAEGATATGGQPPDDDERGAEEAVAPPAEAASASEGTTKVETRSLKTSASVPVAQRNTLGEVARRQLQKRATDLGYTKITNFQLLEARCNDRTCSAAATATASRTVVVEQ